MGKPNRLTLQLIAISGILLSIFVSLLAYKQFQSPISQADLSEQAAGLEAPYLRLARVESEAAGEIVIEVLANTSGLSSNAVDVELSFDPTALQPSSEPVVNQRVLEVFQLNAAPAGLLSFSLFSNPQRDESLLQTNADSEMVLATLHFQQAAASQAITRLDFTPQTIMALYEDPRPEFPTNILRMASGLNLTLE